MVGGVAIVIGPATVMVGMVVIGAVVVRMEGIILVEAVGNGDIDETIGGMGAPMVAMVGDGIIVMGAPMDAMAGDDIVVMGAPTIDMVDIVGNGLTWP